MSELAGTGRLDLVENMNLSSLSTVDELPCFRVEVTPRTMISYVVGHFTETPKLPGVIIREPARISLLSRKQLYEWLSRPFGTELFLNRPVSYFIKNIRLETLIISGSTPVDEAVQLALRRPAELLYDPVIVETQEKEYQIVDFHVLLLAPTQLLAQANHFIRQQMETGRDLSHLLDLNEVLNYISDDLDTLIPFHQMTILLTSPEGQSLEPGLLRTCCLEHEIINDPIADRKAFEYLFHSQQPLLVTEINQAQEWFRQPPDAQIQSWIGFPLVYSGQVICMLSLVRLKQPVVESQERLCRFGKEPFSKSDLDLLANLSTTFTAAIRNAQLHSELRTLAITDPLTGVLNRRGFFDRVTKLFETLPENRQLSILVLDIDYFKKVNDTYGHRIGDNFLRAVASDCRSRLRDSDLIGRYGGEEFIVLLNDTDSTQAVRIAERLRKGIAALKVQTGRGPASVTISVGVAGAPPEPVSLDILIQLADEALYLAKSRGRNRVESWQPNAEQAQPFATSSTAAMHIAQAQPALQVNSNGVDKSNSTSVALSETIQVWIRALEIHEDEAHGHAQRVADLTVKLASHLGIREASLHSIYLGAMLHDVGKIAIPKDILRKPGELTFEEWKIMRRHPEYAYHLLLPIPELSDSLSIPYYHHEKWNGAGYPHQLRGSDIPMEARLFAIVDVWDALQTNRCYRPAWQPDQIYDYILSQSGSHFDPDLVKVFFEVIKAQPA